MCFMFLSIHRCAVPLPLRGEGKKIGATYAAKFPFIKEMPISRPQDFKIFFRLKPQTFDI